MEVHKQKKGMVCKVMGWFIFGSGCIGNMGGVGSKSTNPNPTSVKGILGIEKSASADLN